MNERNRKTLQNFIVFEGLDGAGTTTQMRMLSDRFSRSGVSHHTTCEPSPSPIGRLIRDILTKKMEADPKTLALLFVSDRNEHLYGREGIISYLDRGYTVICDRYLFSSLAYQSIGCGFEYVSELNSVFPLPEHLFFIDADPEICQQRMEERSGREIFDDLELQKKILDWYNRGIDLYRDTEMKVHRLDGNREQEIISENIWKICSI